MGAVEEIDAALNAVSKAYKDHLAARAEFEAAVKHASDLGAGYKRIAAVVVDPDGKPATTGLVRGILGKHK